MVREDLISSAITFLQDPSVASAPLDKRIAFLQSKNLTQEEIDLSLARAGQDASQSGTATPASSNSGYAYSQPPIRQAAPPPYGPYQGGYWPQPPPPKPPKRDWRDWFIMATVMGGVTYGLYFIAKRYIQPLIAPPTPPQLTSDKAAVDAEFSRAFTLIEQLASDTSALKASEESRTQRLDTALGELESVLAELKSGARRREEEGKRLGDEVRGLKDLVPKALESQGKEKEDRLRELGNELRSLKTLVGNRIGGQGGSRPGSGADRFSAQGTGAPVNGNGLPVGSETSGLQQQQIRPAAGSGTSTPLNSSSAVAQNGGVEEGRANSMSSLPDKPPISSAYSRLANGRAAIPAWQMAAAKKNQEESDKKDTSESGTVSEATPAS
ncbi:MAG: peroxisomal membrane protein pex14 [Bogoriella megaspora]|nr:MAG: peroxisomal membrane protein pex14 [Bogoriella megaspora]